VTGALYGDDVSHAERTPVTDGPWRELAFRERDGIDVALLWSAISGRLTVSVLDRRTGEAFTLDAPPDCALDVFHHPHSYAAWRVRNALERLGV
jgi:hypothetical protein